MASLEEIVSLCKRRGFIYPGSEIYGGLAGTFDYGPYGVALKENVKRLWWKTFVTDREDMYGIDAAILMNPKAWEASGHIGGFTDPLVDCLSCKKRQRVDHLVDEKQYKEVVNEVRQRFLNIGSVDVKKKLKEKAIRYDDKEIDWIVVKNLVLNEVELENYTGSHVQTFLNMLVSCPGCGKKEWGVPRKFNMMFKTYVGTTEDEASISYLRPETAGGMFVNFKNVIDSFHPKLPFGLAQTGKAFRNEIAPREFVFRAREFEQMEIEYFVRPENWEAAFEQWHGIMHTFAAGIGLPKEHLYDLEVKGEDLAHYSKRTIDFEFEYPFGRKELWGLAYRTDFDLKAHTETSKIDLSYYDEETKERIVPHVIEPSLGVDRTILAILSSAYTTDELGGEIRSYLKLPSAIAPVRAAVFPLLKNKPELVAKAREIYSALKRAGIVAVFDDNGNIGKRYRRQDEIGTPSCITVDFDTLGEHPELKDTVTLRDRDTGEQERIAITDLLSKLR